MPTVDEVAISPRVVCLSDTHSLHEQVEVPEGDILLHAGDLCNHGTKGEVKAFDAWLGRQPHRHKLFIAGNHDWPFYKHRRYAEMWVKHGINFMSSAMCIWAMGNCRKGRRDLSTPAFATKTTALRDRRS
ncbi:MAG: metallophosphoesterase [Vulcanimicrobiota bacterium]